MHVRWWITAPAVGFLVFSLALGAYRDLSFLLNLVAPRKLAAQTGTDSVHFPLTPSERSRWRDGRYACVKDQVFV